MLAPITGALNEASFNQISIQRLLSTGSIWQAQKSIFVNAALGLPLTLILWVIGLGMYVFYYQNPDPTITSGDAALFKFISTQMPTPMPGLLVATMLAAAMSTLDSGLNSISTVLVKDFYIRYINKTASERKQVKMSRVLVMVIGVIMISVGVLSYLSAETFGQSLVEVGTVFGILEVVMLPAFVFAIFSKRVTTSIIWLTAAICWGMNTGGVHWYSASNNVDNPLIGAIPFSYVLKPLIAAAVLAAISILFRKLKRQFFAQLFTGFWLFFAGYTSMIFFWYLCAKYLGGGKLSFQWPCTPGFVCFFLFGTIAIKIWGKTPESSRYVGLTMGTCKEEMQKDSGLNM
jgi:Na+/proline symporter